MSAFSPGFDELKDTLFNQFEEVDYDPDSGLSPDLIDRKILQFLERNAGLSRVMIRAEVFHIIAHDARISMQPYEWFPSKFEHRGILRGICRQWMTEAEEGVLATAAAGCEDLYRSGAARAGLDTGHISPGWERMFADGLTGLSIKATEMRARLNDGDPQSDFYRAVEIVYAAAGHLGQRFAEKAHSLALEFPDLKDRLDLTAAACSRVPAHSPRTFHEALQFAFFMHEIIEAEGEMVRSMGHFDRVYYPYYEKDISSGRMKRSDAKELLKYFWYKWYSRTRGIHNGKNFLFGGQDRDGHAVENDLTYLALEAYEELDVPDPKLSVRFTEDSSQDLYRRCAEIIRAGRNSFVLLSDGPAVQSLLEAGKTLPDARCYLPIGCYEPAVDGKEAGCTMNIIVSIPKAVELALHDGIDPRSGTRIGPRTGHPRDISDFDTFIGIFKQQLASIIDSAVEKTAMYERQWPAIQPSPILAGTIEGCLETGRDIGEAGPIYNSVGCVGLGLGSACDSLMAVGQAVFEERMLTLEELVRILDGDFAQNEATRQYLLNRVPKWGNGEPSSDAMGVLIADFFAQYVGALTNGRGGRVQPALFSLRHCVEFGAATGALPDGRLSGEPLSAGVGSVTGKDRTGVTALVQSVTGVDYTRLPNGSVLDVTIHPSAVAGDAGLSAFTNLIRGYFDAGGFGIQFNVVDPETLRDAQRNPEAYESLQIRVTGWSARFVTLPKEEQDQYIARVAHRL